MQWLGRRFTVPEVLGSKPYRDLNVISVFYPPNLTQMSIRVSCGLSVWKKVHIMTLQPWDSMVPIHEMVDWDYWTLKRNRVIFKKVYLQYKSEVQLKYN